MSESSVHLVDSRHMEATTEMKDFESLNCCFCYDDEDLCSMSDLCEHQNEAETYLEMISNCFQLDLRIPIQEEYRYLYMICNKCARFVKNIVDFRCKVQNAYNRITDIFHSLERSKVGCSLKQEYDAEEDKSFHGDFEMEFESKDFVERPVEFSCEQQDYLRDVKYEKEAEDEGDVKSESAVKSFTCNVCGKIFSNKYGLRRHTLIHGRKSQEFVCKTCGKICTREANFKQHIITHGRISKGNKFICDGCGKIFLRKQHLQKHILTHAEERKKFICDECGKEFLTEYGLSVHISSHGRGKGDFVCEKCGKVFASKPRLRRHVAVHDRMGLSDKGISISNISRYLQGEIFQEKYVCDVCGKIFNKRATITKHIQVHTSKISAKKFACEECGKTFSMQNYLYKHMEVHNEIKRFVCSVCAKKFRTKAQLETHQLVHSDLRPFVCDICNQRFKRKSNMVSHRFLHTGIKNFNCEVCGKSFVAQHVLAKHYSIHSGAKNFICDVCGKKFFHRCDAVQHCRRVKEIKQPYKFTCDACSKKFRSIVKLEEHLKYHCKVCPKEFESVRAFRAQQKKNRQVISCGVCGHVFSRKDSLQRHLSVHSKQT